MRNIRTSPPSNQSPKRLAKLLIVIVLIWLIYGLLSAYASAKTSKDSAFDDGIDEPLAANSSIATVDTFDNPKVNLSKFSIDKVYVDKSTQTLYLMQDGQAVKSYHIALGDAPNGHKQQEGDERTPEGSYILDYKNENSIAYRSIHVSYPNQTDISTAKNLGVSPGGDIMIHGQMNGYGHMAFMTQQRNWTDGCMAVTNDDMDEIMDAVAVGTPIEIVW